MPGEEIEPVSGSFAVFYEVHYAGLVHAVWASIDDRDLAVEAVDEAFARAYGRWGQVAGGSNPRGWIYRTALNWATSRFRRLATARRLGFQAAQPADRTDNYATVEVVQALSSLSVDHRSVIALRFLLDWDVAATAEALGIAEGTVRSRTSRATDALRAALSWED